MQTPKQEAGDRLETYRQKRRFGVTPEPAPEAPARKPKGGKSPALEFVVQKHDATRLHYDVRLEIAGAMMSFAVPKGPSYDPGVKRLAVETEDHPMAYNRFEGRIPDGEYGAGDVLIWDRGTYETVPPGHERAMREKGHIRARFHGEKLEGDWHFVRTRGEGTKAQWIMWKVKDGYEDASKDIVVERPESVVTAHRATRGPRRKHSNAKAAHDLLATVGAPMRAVGIAELSDPKDYTLEIKHDGYRLLAARVEDDVEIVTRKSNDWTDRFPSLASAVRALKVEDVVLDGEACIIDDEGKSSFEGLQQWLGGEPPDGTFIFAVFDILWLDGRDLRELPIEERRELLGALLKGAPAPLTLASPVPGPFAATLAAARKKGFEGVVAKRKGSTYVPGGAGGWWKLKFRLEQEVAICGYVPLKGTTDQVGALLIAVADGKGAFELAGKVGTGFDHKTRLALAKTLDKLATPKAKVKDAPRVAGARWVKIELVAEITLAEWTRSGSARAASFLALREDKTPEECMREINEPVKASIRAPKRPAKKASAPTPTPSRSVVAITNPSKVLFPKTGITKQDVAAYYETIAPTMLPHLAGRPIGVQRWPNGIEDKAWFQQNAPPEVPAFVRVIGPGGKHDAQRKIIVENTDTLLWLANLAALTIHQWATHVPPGTKGQAAVAKTLLLADYSVLDLDPGDGTWAELVKVAEVARGILETMSLESVVKTSGQRGLHIIVPFKRGPTHEEATAFAKRLAMAVAERLPALSTVERMKAKRGGRLYLDYLQNGDGKTIVAPYSLRATEQATVSTPVAWAEVTRKLDPKSFTLRDVPERVAKVGDLLAPMLAPTQALPQLE